MENPEYNVAAVVCEANNNHKPLVVQDDEFHDYIPVVIPESLGAPLSAHSRRSSSCTLSSLTPPPPRPPKPRQLTPPPISSSTSSESSLGSLRLPPRSVIPSPQESPHPKAEPSGPPQKISTGIRNKIELLLKSLNRVQSEMVQRKPPAVTHAVKRSTSAAASGVRYNWDEQPETSTSKLERPHRLSLIDQRISRRMIAIPHVSPASISAARDDGDRNHIKRTNKNQIVQCKNETDATLKNPVQRSMRKSSTSTQASNHTDVSDTNADQQQIFTPQSTPIPVIKLNDHHSDDHECLVIPPPPSSLPTPTPSIAPSTSFHDPRNDDRECKPKNDFKPNQIIVDEHDKKKETVSAEHGTLACVERTHEGDYETISDLETTPDALPTTICVNIAKTNTPEPVYWAPVTLTIREDGHPAISFYGNPFEYLHRRLKSGLKQISAPPVSDNRPQPIASPTCKIRWSLVTFAIIVLLCIGGTIALAFYIAAKPSAEYVAFVINTGVLNKTDQYGEQYGKNVSEVIRDLFPMLEHVESIQFCYATFYGCVTHCLRCTHRSMAEYQLTSVLSELHLVQEINQTAAVESILDQLKDIEKENLILTIFAANEDVYPNKDLYHPDMFQLMTKVVLQHKRTIIVGDPYLSNVSNIINASMSSDKIAQQISIRINTMTF